MKKILLLASFIFVLLNSYAQNNGMKVHQWLSEVKINANKTTTQGFSPMISETQEKSEFTPRFQTKASGRVASRVDDWSYFYVENHNRIVYEVNEFSKTNQIINPSTSAVLKYDSATFTGQTCKTGQAGNITWKKEFFHMIPLSKTATINKIGLKARSIKDTIAKPAGQDSSKIIVTAYDKSFANVLSVDSFYIKTSGIFLNVLCKFNKPVVTSDTVYINYSMATTVDSFRLAMTNTRLNGLNFGTSQDPKVFSSATLPYLPASTILTIDVNADTVLQNQGGFDFYNVPQISYDFKADFSAKSGSNSSTSDLTVQVGDSVTFSNNTQALNPLLNSDLYWRTIGSAEFDTAGIITSKYIFASGDTLKTLSNPVSKKYATPGTFKVNPYSFLWPWTAKFCSDSSFISIKVECPVTLSASTFDLPSSAAANAVKVASVSASNCPWTVVVDANSTWLSSTSSGSSAGDVTISATENTSNTARTGTITINGKKITITQPGNSSSGGGNTCTYSLSTSSFTCDNNTAKIYSKVASVTAGSTCDWTATVKTGSDWLSTSSKGPGAADVSIFVQANSSSVQREGTIDIGGQILTIKQPGTAAVGGCSYTLNQASYTCPNASSSSYKDVILVSAANSCSWTAIVTSGGSWLATSSVGNGSGTVSIVVLQNNMTVQREGTIDVNGQKLTIIQPGAACAYSLSTAVYNLTDGTGKTQKGIALINTQSGCNWSANVSSGSDWLSVSSAGSGSGAVDITVLENKTGASRTGTLNIENQTLTIVQPSVSTTGIKDNETSLLTVYPNPAKSVLTIDNGNLNVTKGVSLRIQNILGQTVFNQVVNQQFFNLDVTSWTGKGIYFLSVLDKENNLIDIRKIVVE